MPQPSLILRRDFVLRLALSFGCLLAFSLPGFAAPPTAAKPVALRGPMRSRHIPTVAAIVTAYFHNSHADVIVSRLLQTMTLDGKGEQPDLKLVSIYIDQMRGAEPGLKILHEHGIPIFKTVAEALTLGGKSLAVDGVLLIGEHGTYPLSPTGQVMFPKRRLFSQIVDVFDRSGRVVPVYTDKHLADNWADAKWLYDSAHQRGFALMAGSSLPVTWRYPAVDLPRGAHVSEIVATSFGSLEAYGYHGLEILQCLAERRAGGETGVRSVQAFTGEKVWQAAREHVFSRELLEAVVSRQRSGAGLKPEVAFKDATVVIVKYADGVQGDLVFVPKSVDWAAAWRDAETGKITSTRFETQEGRPYMHFTYLVKGVEQMIHTGKPTWPVERTLMTTGILNAYFLSLKAGGRPIETPYLDTHYHSEWDWHQPPAPPATRPSRGP